MSISLDAEIAEVTRGYATLESGSAIYGLLITIVIFTRYGCLGVNLDELNTTTVSPPMNFDTDLRRALLKALTDLENEDLEKSGNNEIDKIIEHAPSSTLSVFSNSVLSTSPTPAITTTVAEMNKTNLSSILVQKSPSVQYSSITSIEKKEIDHFKVAENILTNFTLPNQNTLLESTQERGNYLSITKKKLTPNISSRIVETTTESYDTTTEENEAKVEDVQFFSAPLVAAFTVHQDSQGVPKKVEPIYKTNLKTHQEQVKLLQENKRLNNDISRPETPQQKIDNHSSTIRQHPQGSTNNQFSNPIESFELSTKKSVKNPLHSNTVVSSSSLFRHQQLPNKPPQQFKEIIDNSNNVVSLFPNNAYHHLTVAGKLPLNGQILPVKGPINFHTPIVQTQNFHQFHSIPQINPSFNFNQLPNNQAGSGHHRNRFLVQESVADSFVNNNLNEMSSLFSIQNSIQPSALINPSQKLIATGNFNSLLFASPEKNNRYFRSNLESNHGQSQNSQYDRSQVNHNQFSNALINSGAFGVKSLEDINIISKVLSLNYLDGIQHRSSRSSEQWIPLSKL